MGEILKGEILKCKYGNLIHSKSTDIISTDNIEDTKVRLKKTLELFNRKNIEVIPHYGVINGKNTKEDFKPNFSWKEQTYNHRTNIKAVEDGVIGFIVRTGEKSNISVIDWDEHGEETTNTTEILKRLKDTCTFYIKTPSNGYHFYFKYDKRFTTNRIKVFNNIDIKSNDGLLFFGNSDDGEYIINNPYAVIKQIPEDIIKELLEWKKPIKETDYIDKKNKNIEEQTFLSTDRYKNGERYDITDEELFKYLYDLPTEYLDDTPEWITISFILKKYGYKDVWEKWSKLSKNYNKINNSLKWKTLSLDKNTLDLNYIIKILNDTTYKDEPISHIKKIYKEYQILNERNLKKITHKINVRYLSETLYEDGKDVIICSKYNTGKSTSTISYVEKTGVIVLSIVVLTSTQESHYQSFKKQGIKSFSYKNIAKLKKDFTFINDEDAPYGDDDADAPATHLRTDGNTPSYIDEDTETFEKYIKKSVNPLDGACIFTTIDSLLLFKDRNIDFSNIVVYLDEIHSLILYLLRCDNLTKKRMEIFSFLLQILRDCKQIIMVDGDICNNTVKILELLKRKPFKFIHNEYKSYDGVKCYKMSNMNEMMDMIKKDVGKDEYCICSCNTKTLADKIEQLLLKMDVKQEQILKYTSKSGKPIKNINEEWKNKYAIYSPSIVVGLDFTPSTPINTYAFIDGVNTLNPEQIAQQICRNRNIREVYVYLTNISNILKYEDKDVLKNHYKNNILTLQSSFLSLMNKSFDDITFETKYTENIFTEMYYELEYQNDIMKSSYEYNLFNILNNKGFDVYNSNNINVGLIKEVNDVIKEKIKDDDETLYDMYLNDELEEDNKYKRGIDGVLDILHLKQTDTDLLMKYKDIITTQSLFKTHLKIRCLLTNDEILLKRLAENSKQDLFIKQVKSNVSIVINYKNIMSKYLPEIDLYNYSYKYDDKYLDDEIKMEADDFKYIKSIIDTKKFMNTPLNKRMLVEMMNLYVSHIFSKKMITSVKKNTKVNNKDISYYSRIFDKDLFNINIELFRIYLVRTSNIETVCSVVKKRYYRDLYDDYYDIEILEANKKINFYNEIAREEKIKYDILQEPIEKAEEEARAEEEAIIRAKADKKEHKYLETVSKKEQDTSPEKVKLLKEYKEKHRKYLQNQKDIAERKQKREDKLKNVELTLKQKIMSYVPIENVKSYEDTEYFNRIYEDILKSSFIDKRNILKEYA